MVLVRNGTAQTVQLPTVRGRFLAGPLHVSWPNLTVAGTDYVREPVSHLSWTSGDGGATWTVTTP